MFFMMIHMATKGPIPQSTMPKMSQSRMVVPLSWNVRL